MPRQRRAPLTILYTCRDAELFSFVAALFMSMLTHEDCDVALCAPAMLKAVLTLSNEGGRIDRSMKSVRLSADATRESIDASLTSYKEYLKYQALKASVPA